MAAAASGCGRDPADIRLVAVTKTVTWAEAEALYAEGQRDFGENRLQEALHKQSLAPADCRWHLIGSLQSNKVRKAIGRFVLIHGVDSLALASKISQCSQEAGVTTSILLQVNTSGEATKHGMTAGQCVADFEALLLLPGISIQGLMTIAPLVEDEHLIRQCFASLRQLRDTLNDMAEDRAQLRHLSMGMSHDFTLAIAEGATIVRIGTALWSA